MKLAKIEKLGVLYEEIYDKCYKFIGKNEKPAIKYPKDDWGEKMNCASIRESIVEEKLLNK